MGRDSLGDKYILESDFQNTALQTAVFGVKV
jgi:hypothetical protein